MEEYTFDDREVEEAEPTVPTEQSARPIVGLTSLASADASLIDELIKRIETLEAKLESLEV